MSSDILIICADILTSRTSRVKDAEPSIDHEQIIVPRSLPLQERNIKSLVIKIDLSIQSLKYYEGLPDVMASFSTSTTVSSPQWQYQTLLLSDAKFVTEGRGSRRNSNHFGRCPSLLRLSSPLCCRVSG